MSTKFIKQSVMMLSSALLLLASFASVSAYAALSRHPYVQSVSEDRVVMRWRTTAAANSRVSYGTSLGQLNTYADDSASSSEHEVVITGLNPNTKYYYSVGSSTTVEAGNDANHYFTTAPVDGSNQKVRIWAIGDAGTGYVGQTQVRDAFYNLDKVQTDVVLALGDNAYNSGTDSQYTKRFFNVYKDLFRNTAVWATRGNHERNQRVHEEAFSHPTNGESGGVASGSELYFSFDYGNIHFVNLDSYTRSNLNGTAMYTWLEQDLASTTQKWIIAFWHHPPYSRSSGHNSDTEAGQRITREKANPILEKYGVDLQLGGHNHFYSRTFLINNHYGKSNTYSTAAHAIDGGDGRDANAYNKGSDTKGAVYVLAGSSGKIGYTPNKHPANYVEVKVLGSMVIDVEGDRMDVRMLRENGTIEDYFAVLKSASTNQAPSVNAGVDQSAESNVAINLNGTVSDDGLPAGSTLTSSWSKVSGPGTVTFANANAVDTTVTFSDAGSYLLKLNASDGDLSSSDTATFTVITATTNQAPTVSAGSDQSVEIGIVVNLNGTVTDDGLPNGSSVSSSWSKVSGPGTVTFGNANAASTTASFSLAGIYELNLQASDTQLTSTDTVTVTMIAANSNQAPIVNAGSDFVVSRRASFSLQGSASDDGLPAPATLSYRWSKVSGPGDAVFAAPTKANSSVRFLAAGRYVLRLTVSDGELTTRDDVRATVSRPGSGGAEFWLLIIFAMAAVFKLVTVKRS